MQILYVEKSLLHMQTEVIVMDEVRDETKPVKMPKIQNLSKVW